MPYTLHIDPKVNCVFYRFYGAFEMNMRHQSMDEVLAHPDFKIGMNFLRDVREQPFPADITYQSISEGAQYMLQKNDLLIGNCRWAVVVKDAENYAKMHQFIVTGRLSRAEVERKPFRDIEKAKEWLDLPADYQIKYPEES